MLDEGTKTFYYKGQVSSHTQAEFISFNMDCKLQGKWSSITYK